MYKPQSLQAVEKFAKNFESQVKMCACCGQPGPASWDKADKIIKLFYHEYCLVSM